MDPGEPPSREFLDYVASLGPKVVRSEDDKMNWPQRYIRTDMEIAHDRSVLSVVDRLLEPQTPAHFLGFAFDGILPDGSKTSLPLLHLEEGPCFATPYASWAPEPHSRKSHSMSTAEVMMVRIGSNEDDRGLCLVEKHLHAMKTRLWEGLLPMSDYRWHDRKLDELQHHAIACQHLSAVVDVFTYLNKPSVKARLRQCYDSIYDELSDLEKAINALRARNGSRAGADADAEPKPHDKTHERVSITGLWKEYIQARFRCMTATAHSWVMHHAGRLRELRLAEYVSKLEETDDEWDPELLPHGDRMQDLSQIVSLADVTIMLPMAGYKGCESSTSGGVIGPWGGSLEERVQRYFSEVKYISRQNTWRNTAENVYRRRRGEPSLQKPTIIAVGQMNAQNTVRRALRGETVEVGIQSWVRELNRLMEPAKRNAKATDCNEQIDKMDTSSSQSVQADDIFSGPAMSTQPLPKKFGFVAYRLDYQQNQQEWEGFSRVLKADMSRWSQGLKGAEPIKDLAALHWIDGREAGIPEGDIEAAKKHFVSMRDSQTLPSGMQDKLFFVADKKATASYLPPPIFSRAEPPPPGLSGGHLLLVDADHDPNEPESHADEYPGWTGQMRILGSLIFGEIYSFMHTQSLFPEYLWPLASGHPEQVYVGVTVRRERGVWENIPGIRPAVQDILRGAAAMVGEKMMEQMAAMAQFELR